MPSSAAPQHADQINPIAARRIGHLDGLAQRSDRLVRATELLENECDPESAFRVRVEPVRLVQLCQRFFDDLFRIGNT